MSTAWTDAVCGCRPPSISDELMADEQENRGQRGLGGNFAVAAGVGVGWWAMLFAGEMARAGGRPGLLSLHSTALVYLLLLVQGSREMTNLS